MNLDDVLALSSGVEQLALPEQITIEPPQEKHLDVMRRGMKLKDLLQRLNERERYILWWRFEDGLDLGEIAEKFSITRERVRQIEVRALRKLRSMAGSSTWLGELEQLHRATLE